MLTLLGFFWNDTNILVNSENQLPQIYYLDYVYVLQARISYFQKR
jgi:hypothetical protein